MGEKRDNGDTAEPEAAGGQGTDWRAWQAPGAPDPPLLTRSQVLELVERWGTRPEVDERTLRFWEKRGLVPRPRRSYHNGAVRSRYPSWVADLIAIIRLEQRIGRSLAELMPFVRQQAHRLSLDPRPHPFPAMPSLGDHIWGYTGDGPRFEPVPVYDPPTLPGYARSSIFYALETVIKQQFHHHRFETTRVRVQLVDDAGAERVYEVPLPEGFTADPLRGLSLPIPPWEKKTEPDGVRPTDTKE